MEKNDYDGRNKNNKYNNNKNNINNKGIYVLVCLVVNIYIWKMESCCVYKLLFGEKKKRELCFRGRWAPKLTKGPCNSSNWAQDPMKVWKLSWRISSFNISKNTLCWFWEKN